MEKKNNKEKKVKSNVKKLNIQTTEQGELKSFLIIILVVVVCAVGLWGITKVFVDKEETKEEEKTSVSVNYNKAIVGTILNRPYDEYYVVIYDTEGDKAIDMSSLVSSYQELESAKHIYSVDLSNKLNKDYYDPANENVKAKTTSEFKFGDTTLIKVKKGKVNKYIVDYSKMKKELGIK